MSEYLVIRLGPEPAATTSWVAVDQTGALLGPVGTGPLADAAASATGRQVIALVPALEVLRARAEVPLRGRSKLLQVLPFALEEQLAEDVEELHFAAGRREPDDRVPVAVVRRSLMDSWIGCLQAAGLAPQHLYSEGDALGVVPNTATLLVEKYHAVLAEADGSVTAMDIEGLDGLLELWLARQATGEPATAIHLVVYGAPDILAAQQATWDRLRLRVQSMDLRTTAEGILARLAAQIVTSPGIDLLQGAFARRTALIRFTPAWRVAAALFLAFALVVFVARLAELRSMSREIASLDADIDRAFHYVFPDAGPVQDPRGQLSSRLQQLGDRSAGEGHDFLETLRIISQAVAGNAAARVEAINYRAGNMELRVRAPDVQTLDRIQQRVSESGGLKAQIQSANASGNEVIGRLQITRTKG
jgi:general secretion pathway protein L